MSLTKVQKDITTITGSGGGAKNYITNGDAESSTDGWVRYVESKAATFTYSTLMVTVTAHGLSDNDTVSFTSITGATGLGAGTLYYVTVKSANTFQIAVSPGDAPVLFFSDGTGVMAIPKPLTGTGGSPGAATALARSTSAPLSGFASFTATKAASNTMGYGYSYDFTIDSKDKARMLQLSLDGLVVSGTFTSGSKAVGSVRNDSDLTVWLYDVTNAKMVDSLSDRKILSNSTTLAWPFSATFQTPSDSVSYRLILHHSTANTAAHVYKFDNVSVSPSVYVYGSPVTDWKPCTMTLTNAGTAVITAFERRVGDSYEYQGRVVIGSTLPTGNIYINTPRTMDSTKLTTNQVLGETWALRGTYYTGVIGYLSATQVQMFSHSSGNQWNATTPGTWANTEAFTFNFRAPVLGASSSVQMSDGSTTAVVGGSYYGSGQSLADATWTTIKFATKLEDTAAIYNSTTGIGTIVTPGLYEFDSALAYSIGGYSTPAIFSARLQINGATNYGMGDVGFTAAANPNIPVGKIRLPMKSGDTFQIQGYKTNWGGSSGFDADGTKTKFSFVRVSGPQAIAASETVAASYGSSLGQAIGTSNVVFFNSKDYDTHGMFNPSTGVGTIPIAGLYRFHFRAYFGASLPASTNFFAFLRKNAANIKSLSDKTTAATATGYELVGGATVQFMASETFDFVIGQNAGGTKALYADAMYVYCTIERVK